MNKSRFRAGCGVLLLIFCGAVLGSIHSCAYRAPSNIPFFAGADSLTLYACSSKAVAGIFTFTGKSAAAYSFDTPVPVPQNSSLEVEYLLTGGSGGGESAVLRVGEEAPWLLPLSLDFLQSDEPPELLRYSIPLEIPEINEISLKITGAKKSALTLALNSLRVAPRFYGFSRTAGAVALSPFVKKEDGYIISVPKDYMFDGRVFVRATGAVAGAVIDCNTRAFAYMAAPPDAPDFPLSLPAALIGKEPFPLRFYGEAAGLQVLASLPQKFPAEPRVADPYFVLTFPQVSWRDERYEVFCWESFPSILIFDTSTYDIQDKLFKRLAFFAEKKGFRGRLARDDEIAELHGWNAHDYNAETLATFFNLVHKQHFPITREESELQEILIANGIIRQEADSILPGTGALISISRESSEYLRKLFMAHEGFHGLFFIDEDFRSFSAQRWNNLERVAKRFILSYFDYQQYDISDSQNNSLVINEFMAHIMQQSAGAAAEYFGKTIASRIDASDWRRKVLPPKDDATGTWPRLATAFDTEARAFSDYARRRWGLDCGRVWRVTVPPPAAR